MRNTQVSITGRGHESTIKRQVMAFISINNGWKFNITMTPHERHGVSNHRNSKVCNRLLRLTKETSRHWPYVRRIHRLPMDSPHKEPVTRKTFPCHDVITIYALSSPRYTEYRVMLDCIIMRLDCIQGIKTGSREVCGHNARGCVWTGSPIPRPLDQGIGRTVRTSLSASWQQNLTDRS